MLYSVTEYLKVLFFFSVKKCMILFSTSHSLITVLSCCLNAWYPLWVLESLSCALSIPFLLVLFSTLQGSVLWSPEQQTLSTSCYSSLRSSGSCLGPDKVSALHRAPGGSSRPLKGQLACTAAMALGDYECNPHKPS